VPDTVIQVDDEQLGIRANYWVDSVTRSRKPETITHIRLMRVEDLIFGAPEEGDGEE
jgi:prophage tail gpP-like protein